MAGFKEQLESRCCVYVYMTMCVGPLEVPPEEWLQDGPETAQGPALIAADQEATAALGAMDFALLNLLNFNPKTLNQLPILNTLDPFKGT